MDEVEEPVQKAVHALLAASTSPEGYAKLLGCTLTNAFLGELVNGQRVLNAHSYNFRLFGMPGHAAPWGWTFFGHHLALACVVQGARMALAPSFMGAEPDRIDAGPHAGLRLFSNEEVEGLNLMRGLAPAQQGKAQLSAGMDGDHLPEDRWNPFDERHLGGARQDNRVVPYGASPFFSSSPCSCLLLIYVRRTEGCPVREFTPDQKAAVMRILRAFNITLPAGPLAARLALLEAHLDDTYFAWIGGFSLGDPYYYRIHSPVTWCEFDFHCGIFLTNTSPAKCHVHTINRAPNAGDYGKALLKQWRVAEAS